MGRNALFKYFRHIQGAPITLTNVHSLANNQYFGRIAVGSANPGALYPVATLVVASDSIFHTAITAPAGVAIAAQTGVPNVIVNSIVENVGFILTTAGSTAAGSYVIHWQMFNPFPKTS